MISASLVAYAASSVENEAVPTGAADSTSVKAIAAALTISLGAVAAAIAMGISISKASESMARQPEAEGSIRTGLLPGRQLVVAIMIIFVPRR